MKKKKTTKRRRTVVLVTPFVETTSSGTNAGEIIWYDEKKSSFVETTMNYLKGWFK